MPDRTCSVDDCGDPHYGRGWCKKHYQRWLIHGSVEDRVRTYKRTYDLDESYFDQIDTPDKAYWLGFISGDGCVRDRGLLVVALATVDAAHVESLKAALCSSAPVRQYTATRKSHTYPYTALFVQSRRLTNALASLGVTPRKSLTLQAWQGSDQLMRDYWRGLIDADGTIMATPNQWQVSLIGSESIVHGFADWARSVVPETTAQTKQIGNIWSFKVRGRVRCRAMAQALYDDCSTALERKAIRAAAIIAAGPPRRVGHPTSEETRLLLSRVAGRPRGSGKRHPVSCGQLGLW